MGDSPFWGPFWELSELTDRQRAFLLEVRTALHRRLVALGTDGGIYSMIHADLHPGNVLVEGERLNVIDFDDAGFGFHAYDLAVALFGNTGRPDFDSVRDALVGGYRAQRPLAEEVVALLPMFDLIRGLALLGWIHERPELERGFVPSLVERVCRDAEPFV